MHSEMACLLRGLIKSRAPGEHLLQPHIVAGASIDRDESTRAESPDKRPESRPLVRTVPETGRNGRSAEGPPPRQMEDESQNRPLSTFELFGEHCSGTVPVPLDDEPSLRQRARSTMHERQSWRFVGVVAGQQRPDGEIDLSARLQWRADS